NNTPKLRQVSLKLLQLAANLRDWLDLEGIISYYGWPGKAPVAFTLTFMACILRSTSLFISPKNKYRDDAGSFHRHSSFPPC
ncbi:MAG: hypothetical protein IJH70_07245, partial [Oscillospiraceae bacterium]|nr:hypothetical protein [Oscillospiraceae bacterium]